MHKPILYTWIMIMTLTSCALHKAAKKTPIDLSHAFDEHTIYWPTEKGFEHVKEYFGITEKGYFYSSYRICTAEHGGTHIDAPIHFNEKGQTLDQIPLERLMGPAAIIDVKEASSKDRDYEVSIDDLKRWEAQHQETLADKIVLLNTGFAQYWPNRLSYLGTDQEGAEAIKNLHFPGLAPDAARWLAEERHIRAVGIDTASIDRGQSSLYETHRTLFKFNIPAFENVANLDAVPAHGCEVIALPMKIKHGSGGPLRIIALVPAKAATNP